MKWSKLFCECDLEFSNSMLFDSILLLAKEISVDGQLSLYHVDGNLFPL